MDWYEKFIREPRHRFESSRDESGIEADLASVQSATDAEVNHASASQPNIFTFGAAPQPVHYDTSLADPGPLQSPGLGSLSFSATQDTSTERCIKSDGSVADAADNLISAMTKMMNNRGRKSSQTIDEGIDLESDNTLSQPQRQMLHKVLSVALERLSDENEATVQDTDSEKRSWFKCAVCSKQTRLRCEMK